MDTTRIPPAGDPFTAKTPKGKLSRCDGCRRRVPRGELVEVGPEMVGFGHGVREGERYCKSCAVRRGVV